MTKQEFKAITKELFFFNKKRLLLWIAILIFVIAFAMIIVFVPFFNFNDKIKSLFDKLKHINWQDPTALFGLVFSILGYLITALSIPLKVFELMLMLRFRLMLAKLIKDGILDPKAFIDDIRHSYLSRRKQRKLEEEIEYLKRIKSDY